MQPIDDMKLQAVFPSQFLIHQLRGLERHIASVSTGVIQGVKDKHIQMLR